MIYPELPAESIQDVALANKALCKSVLELRYAMPLPLSSRNYLEAQRRITKTIVISGNSFSCTVADALHQFMVIVGEVPALEFSRENIMTLLKIVEGCSSL